MIEVVREDLEQSTIEIENCCFCRNPTAFWYKPKDVACCLECAANAEPGDVPDKQTWCKRERIAQNSDSLETAIKKAPGLVWPNWTSKYEVQ